METVRTDHQVQVIGKYAMWRLYLRHVEAICGWKVRHVEAVHPPCGDGICALEWHMCWCFACNVCVHHYMHACVSVDVDAYIFMCECG